MDIRLPGLTTGLAFVFAIILDILIIVNHRKIGREVLLGSYIFIISILSLATRQIDYGWEKGEAVDRWIFWRSGATRVGPDGESCILLNMFSIDTYKYGQNTGKIFRGIYPLRMSENDLKMLADQCRVNDRRSMPAIYRGSRPLQARANR